MDRTEKTFFLGIMLPIFAVLFGTSAMIQLMAQPDESEPILLTYEKVQTVTVPVPDPTATPTPNPILEVHKDLVRKIDSVPIMVQELVLGDSYRVFITAYCAEECGWNYWTSSGTYCHRSSDINRYEPSTAAIDLRYWNYGDMFYIPSEDRVYIAEDTGAFRGMWLDLYVDDMSDVRSFNTRYETVYTVAFEYHEEPISKYDVRPYISEVMKNC